MRIDVCVIVFLQTKQILLTQNLRLGVWEFREKLLAFIFIKSLVRCLL